MIKNALKNWVFHNLLSLATIKDVLTYNEKKREIYLDGQIIPPNGLNELREEINWLLNSRIWSIINGSVDSQAKQVIFDKSKTNDDLIAGKSMLYTLDLQRKIIQILINAK